jgi:hypothetical protein
MLQASLLFSEQATGQWEGRGLYIQAPEQWEGWRLYRRQGSGRDGACVYRRQGSGRDGASTGARAVGGMGPVLAPGQWGWGLCVQSPEPWEGRGQYQR